LLSSGKTYCIIKLIKLNTGNMLQMLKGHSNDKVAGMLQMLKGHSNDKVAGMLQMLKGHSNDKVAGMRP
jgi:hypothetical protein